MRFVSRCMLWLNCEDLSRLGDCLIECSIEPVVYVSTPGHHLLAPAQIFATTFERPTCWRSDRDVANIADLVGNLQLLRAIYRLRCKLV